MILGCCVGIFSFLGLKLNLTTEKDKLPKYNGHKFQPQSSVGRYIQHRDKLDRHNYVDSTIQLREAKTDAKDIVDSKSEILARIKHHMWESYGFIFSQGTNLVNEMLSITYNTLLEAKTIEINTKWISLKFSNLPLTGNRNRSV